MVGVHDRMQAPCRWRVADAPDGLFRTVGFFPTTLHAKHQVREFDQHPGLEVGRVSRRGDESEDAHRKRLDEQARRWIHAASAALRSAIGRWSTGRFTSAAKMPSAIEIMNAPL